MALVRETRPQARPPRRRRPAGPTTLRAQGTYRTPPASEWITVHMPPGPRQLGPTIVWCHGLFGTALDTTPFPASRLAEQLVAASCPVLVADLGGPSTWGNDDAIDAVNDALTYGANGFGARTDRVGLVGLSMGGMLAANWAARNITRVAFLYTLVPALNLAPAMARNPGIEAAVETAYGGPAGWTAAQPTHDPIAPAIAGPLGGLRDRFRIDAALNDELFLNADYEQFLAACPGIDLRWLIGDHGESLYRDPHEFGDWIAGIVERYG